MVILLLEPTRNPAWSSQAVPQTYLLEDRPQMRILDISDEEFESHITQYHPILQKAMREARIQVRAEWDKWEQDILIDPQTPTPFEIQLGRRLPIQDLPKS